MKLKNSLTIGALFLALSIGANAQQNNAAKTKKVSSKQQTETSKQIEKEFANKLFKGEDGVQRITLEDAKAAFDSGKAIIIDVRGTESYKVKHVKGSLDFADVLNNYKQLPKDKLIIAYCSCPSEHTSGRAVQILSEKGMKNAAAMQGGTAAWEKAGFPMESGAK